MHTLQQSYRGISLLVQLNGDWLIYAGTIALSLGTGAYIVSLF